MAFLNFLKFEKIVLKEIVRLIILIKQLTRLLIG